MLILKTAQTYKKTANDKRLKTKVFFAKSKKHHFRNRMDAKKPLDFKKKDASITPCSSHRCN